jgi:prevent-host-death family protein
LEPAPTIITITDFRRDAAGIIGDAVASGAPVFVTQHSRVTAVVLSRDRYERLLHRSALVEQETAAEGADPLPAAKAETRPATALVETLFGLVDSETADFLEIESY